MAKIIYKNVVALSPHTDDIEFGCGGTLARLIEEGANIYPVVFSKCEKSVPQGFPNDVLIKEMHTSYDHLNILPQNRILFDYPVREFPKFRQEILEDMVKINKELEPDLILTPSSFDVHQDHKIINNESIRAFRFSTLLGYELPWNNLEFKNQLVIELKKKHIEKKVDCINSYNSQKFRQYSDSKLFFDESIVRGIQNKRARAEIFEVIKMYF